MSEGLPIITGGKARVILGEKSYNFSNIFVLKANVIFVSKYSNIHYL